jgi:hypothetical protein
MQWNVEIAGPFFGADDRLAIMFPLAVFLYLADLLYLQVYLSHNSSSWHHLSLLMLVVAPQM